MKEQGALYTQPRFWRPCGRGWSGNRRSHRRLSELLATPGKRNRVSFAGSEESSRCVPIMKVCPTFSRTAGPRLYRVRAFSADRLAAMLRIVAQGDI